MPQLTKKLYEEVQLLQFFTQRISSSEYARKPSERKDIYAFIHKLIQTLIQVSDEKSSNKNETIRKILPKQEPHWTALVKATQQDMALSGSHPKLGRMQYVSTVNIELNMQRRGNIITHPPPPKESGLPDV